jgi:hypothetical protein
MGFEPILFRFLKIKMPSVSCVTITKLRKFGSTDYSIRSVHLRFRTNVYILVNYFSYDTCQNDFLFQLTIGVKVAKIFTNE